MAHPPPNFEGLRDVVYHVFMPPKLPQQAPSDTTQRHIDLELIRLTIHAVKNYRTLALRAQEEWDHISKMLLKLALSIGSPQEPDQMQRTLSVMGRGDVLVLWIRAQNSVVLVRKRSAVTTFEIFEVQTSNVDLMSIAGKICRSFPGRAVEVPNMIAEDPGFFREISNFLVRMDRDVLKESTATTTKAGSTVVEVRDSAHPHYISQLFVGILRGMGEEIEPRRVNKRIGDEVLWHNAYKPWHRSPVWLIIRVALQTSLSSNTDYKHFMVYFEAQLLHRALGYPAFPSDLLFVMRVKLARRLYKVQHTELPEFVVETARIVTDNTGEILKQRWTEVQLAQTRSSHWDPAGYTFEESIKQSLPNSRAYIDEVFRGRSNNKPSSLFSPTHRARLSNVRDFVAFTRGALSSAFSVNPHVALFDFEESVHSHLSIWAADNLDAPSACKTIASCLTQYISHAPAHYAKDICGQSIMALTIMTLWVALDEIVISQHPLLLDYSPELREELLEPLLLRTKVHINRACAIQRYLRKRHATAQRAGRGSVFSDNATTNSLAVRCFRQSPAQQQLKQTIEQDAQAERDLKLEELRQLNETHRTLVQRASRLEHEKVLTKISKGSKTSGLERYTHVKTCNKCKIEKQAAAMKVHVHEWPLPTSPLDAEALVFELRCPSALRIWRDTTYKILFDIGSSQPKSSPNRISTLKAHRGLEKWLSSYDISSTRIIFASSNKSFTQAHYSTTRIPANESSVCVNNGLSYKLYDSTRQTWAGGPFSGQTFAKYGTLSFPPGSLYQHLNYALAGTSHNSNQVIADQSQCPSNLSLLEHIAFGTLRSGPRLQWMNIARGIEENLLSFSHKEVYLLHAQAAWQIGPLTEDSCAHDWHIELDSVQYGQLLVNQSGNVLDRVKANWLEGTSVRIIVMLVTRLLASTQDEVVRQDSYRFLRKARHVTLGWLKELSAKLHEAEIKSHIVDYQERVCEMAAICHSTWDVDPVHLESLLSSADDFAAFILCSVILHDNRPPSPVSLTHSLQSLLLQDLRLAHRTMPLMLSRLRVSPQHLDAGILQIWPDYNANGDGWIPLTTDSSWVSTTTRGPHTQTVHLDVLDGQLLIDGKPLGRLPQEFISHPTYVRLFGQKVLAVVPGGAPGMEFSTLNRVNGYKVSFALNQKSKALVVQAHKDGSTSELIPHAKVEWDFPVFFSSDFHHWAHLESNTVEFRPLATPWEIDPRNWQLKYSAGSYYVMELAAGTGVSFLANIHSSLFQSISQRLAPLEASRYLYVVYSTERQISVELPRMKLSFYVNSDQALESVNIGDQVVDENQSSGTMLGLQNQLLLRAKRLSAGNLSRSRTVLIPHGKVQFSIQKHHALVNIDTGTDREVLFHQYRVDTDLQCLASSTSLTSRLFKIYLHALTSHCLPDPLTGRTGTEEALYELSEPATSSFEQITKEQAELLKLIGALTTKREYYPVHLRSMQTVRWGNLSPLSQHYAFATAVESLLRRADTLRLFHPLDFDPMTYVGKLELNLLERAARRTHMYYPPESTARLQTILDEKTCYDHAYTGRDCNLAQWSRSEHDAYWASSLFYGRWNQPTYVPCSLVSRVESWKDVDGPSNYLSLTYCSDWLEIKLSESWLSIYNLCRHISISGNRYQLIMCLASATYGKRLPDALLRVVLAFATEPTFRNLPPPNHPSYQLADGYQPTRYRVGEIVTTNTVPSKQSPAWSLTQEKGEAKKAFHKRRDIYYKTQISTIGAQLADSLMRIWPSMQTQALFEFAPWFNIRNCISNVYQYFASCSRNAELYSHLIAVEMVLGSKSPTQHLESPAMPPFVNRLHIQQQSPPDFHKNLSLQKMMKSRTYGPPGDSSCNSRFTVMINEGDPSDTTRLARLFNEFRENEIQLLHCRYGNDLETSRIDLTKKGAVVFPDQPPTPKTLNLNFQRCSMSMQAVYTEICSRLGPLTLVESVIEASGIWPRLTPRAVLHKLSFSMRPFISAEWKSVLVKYAWAFVEYQRSQHLIALAQETKLEELLKELDLENTSSGLISCDPDWLLIQIDGNFRVRDVQSKVAAEMISPSSRANTVLQLNMGEGKSSVIVPIIAASLADSSRLVRIVVLKPLWRQMFQLLVDRLAGLAGRRIYYLPFGRHIQVGRMQASHIRAMYDECMRDGGVLLVQPEHILSFKLMGIDRLISSSSADDKAVARTLWDMQCWLKDTSRDILDESDEILHVRYQLVYTVGQQQPLEDHPDRWTTTQQIFPLVARHISLLKSQFPESFKYVPGLGGQFPAIRIMPDSGEAVVRLIQSLAEDVLDGRLPNLNFIQLPFSARAAALRFVTEKDLAEHEYHLLKNSCDSTMWKGLLLLRGLLASGILVFALKDRHYRVDYGLDPSRSLVAVPYLAKDIPSLRAEFGHPDVTVTLTCLSYYYRGLNDVQVGICFDLLLKLDNPGLEYEQWVRSNDAISQELRHLNNVNIKDQERFKKSVIPAFFLNTATINFYLSAVVFPKGAKEFPNKLATSGWDLAETKEHVTTGFSGTNDNRYLLPTSISQADPVKQSSTNARVLTYLLEPENNSYACTRDESGETRSAREFLQLLVSQQPEIRVLLDVGAQMLELKNEELVRYWLTLRPDISAGLFFSERDELMVLPQNGTPVPLVTSPFSQQLERCIVYLDDGHTRGTDLKLPKYTRAAVTLGPKVTKDRLSQGCMRMRKLGHGQSVMFFAPAEIDTQIRRAAGLNLVDRIDTLDILRWAMLVTCSDLQRHIPHWAQQGVEYKRRAKAEEEYKKAKDINTLEQGWITPESRPLEDMYGITDSASTSSDSFTALAFSIPSLRTGLEALGVQMLENPGMDEEQEREVSHEIERQQQIERPPKHYPMTPSLHPDLKTLVQTGSIPSNSSGFVSLFLPLQSFGLTGLSAWSGDLFATADFYKTVFGSSSKQLHDFMRPFNWILFAACGILVVLSPYEVNELLPLIRSSTRVRLCVYAPRVTLAMRSFSDLRFYSVPNLPTRDRSAVPLLLQLQLNLWAGQLYLENHEEYRALCAFLGVYVDFNDVPPEENFRVQSDGFVAPTDRQVLANYLPEYIECGFTGSPIQMLRELIGRRRKGIEYTRTHLGQVLHPRRLTPNDF
ncbi:hypothetical protein BDV93DRAFT_607811 [Ceratobasidium sp. AG-I]|nr:hypothetical protein BDV93DRAFT_607811 [Ceratobasidium sp. AG-I]